MPENKDSILKFFKQFQKFHRLNAQKLPYIFMRFHLIFFQLYYIKAKEAPYGLRAMKLCISLIDRVLASDFQHDFTLLLVSISYSSLPRLLQ
jgi:hypothetical protein